MMEDKNKNLSTGYMLNEIQRASEYTGQWSRYDGALERAKSNSLDAECAAAIAGFRGNDVSRAGERAFRETVATTYEVWAQGVIVDMVDDQARYDLTYAHRENIRQANQKAQTEQNTGGNTGQLLVAGVLLLVAVIAGFWVLSLMG